MAEPPHPICDAAGDGRLDDVRHYVEQDAGLINHRDFHGKTALRLASMYVEPEFDEGQVAVVEMLLQKGADVTPCAYGTTALFEAAAEGRADMVGLLLAHGGSDVDVMDDDGTGLFYACADGSMKVVMQLLEAGADPAVQRTGANKQSPYEVAVEKDDEDVISTLQQWDRVYMLTRARRVRDDVHNVLGAHEDRRTHYAPSYLRGRVTAMGLLDGDTVELPQVEVRADHGVCDEREGESVTERRKRDRAADDQSEMEEIGGVVARHVLQELSGELFVELLGMCELASDHVEDEVEEENDDGGDDDENESASGDSDDM